MWEIILGIAISVIAVALAACVLFQSSKDKRLSGAIVGSSDNFLGKSKAQSKDKILGNITAVLAIVFAVLVLVMYILVAKGI